MDDSPKLTPEQQADAGRLAAIYKQWKADNRASGGQASQEWIAHELKMSQSAFSQYCRGIRPINVELLTKLNLALGWRPEEISPSLALKMAQVAEAAGAVDPEDHAPVRMVDAKASAGRGTIVFSSDVTKTLMFRRDWLARMGARPEDCLGFDVGGRSMPDVHIIDGSVVLANTRQTEPVNNRIYVMWIDDELFVKQLTMVDGRWIARSRNAAMEKDYPDMPIDIDDRLVGRVFWCGFGL